MGLEAVLFQEKRMEEETMWNMPVENSSPRKTLLHSKERAVGLLVNFEANWKVGNSSYTLTTRLFSGFIVSLIQNLN